MPLNRTRLTALAAIASGALLLLPAVGDAATTFGSRFKDGPNDPGCGMLSPCTLVSYIHPIDPNGDPYAGGAPSDGVITKFRIQAYAPVAATEIRFHVADIRLDPNSDNALAKVVATGPRATIPVGDGVDVPILDVPSRVTVKRGQHIAIDNTTVMAVHASNSDRYTYVFGPLVEGDAAQSSNAAVNELLVAASIEPDADEDGFGDETQDSCPTDASRQGECGKRTIDVKDGLRIGSLRVSGGKIRYSLSARATVSLRLASGRACVSSGAVRCKRYVSLGRPFAGGGKAGANRVALPKPHGRRLAPGAYRVTVSAHRAGGNTVRKTARFTISR